MTQDEAEDASQTDARVDPAITGIPCPDEGPVGQGVGFPMYRSAEYYGAQDGACVLTSSTDAELSSSADQARLVLTVYPLRTFPDDPDSAIAPKEWADAVREQSPDRQVYAVPEVGPDAYVIGEVSPGSGCNVAMTVQGLAAVVNARQVDTTDVVDVCAAAVAAAAVVAGR